MRRSFAQRQRQSHYSIAEELARILLTPIVDPEVYAIRWIVAPLRKQKVWGRRPNLRGEFHNVPFRNCDALWLTQTGAHLRTYANACIKLV